MSCGGVQRWIMGPLGVRGSLCIDVAGDGSGSPGVEEGPGPAQVRKQRSRRATALRRADRVARFDFAGETDLRRVVDAIELPRSIIVIAAPDQ